MPLYMDRHDVPGVTPQAVAEAHEKDLAIQAKYGVEYRSYWLDEARGRVFCLVDAPSEEAAAQVHREAHGLVAHQIIQVEPQIVEYFLGQTEGAPPAPLAFGASGETRPDTPFRAILITDITGSTTITRQLGDAGAMELLRTHNAIVRDALKTYGGREVKHMGDGFMASFASVSAAVECAIAVLRSFDAHNSQNPESSIHLHLGLSAGEPVEEDQDLFGATVQMAARLCGRAKADQILVSSAIREVCLGKNLPFRDFGRRRLKGFDRPVQVYEVEWLGE